jgi:hypothetical protein
MTTAGLIPTEELTKEKVLEIFRNAYMDASIDADGDLLVTVDGIVIAPVVDTARRLLMVKSIFTLRPGTTRTQVLDLSNRINDELIFVRACCPAALPELVLWVDHFIDTNAGVTGGEIVDEVRRFRLVISSIPERDADGILT